MRAGWELSDRKLTAFLKLKTKEHESWMGVGR